MSPRRTAISGPDMAAGIPNNIRLTYEGIAKLTGKNEMDNPIFNEFTPGGKLKGWTIDHPPEETGFGIYITGPGHLTSTRQGKLSFGSAFYEQKEPMVDGPTAPDVTHVASVPPFSLPPQLELVEVANVGFAAGWWAVTFAYGIGEEGSGGTTQCAPIAPIELGQGQILRIPLGGTAPEGVTWVEIGMAGPFTTELAALDAREVFRQVTIPTSPRLPAYKDLLGPYVHEKTMSFTQNTAKVGSGSTPSIPDLPGGSPDPGAVQGVPKYQPGVIPDPAAQGQGPAAPGYLLPTRPAVQVQKNKQPGRPNNNSKRR